MTNSSFKPHSTDDDDLTPAQKNVKAKALEASKALEKIDPELLKFWNLVLAERRLYIVNAKIFYPNTDQCPQ